MRDDDTIARWDAWEPGDEEPVGKCDGCDEDIFPGDDLYDIDGDTLCEDCMKDWLEEHHRRAKADGR